MKGDITLENISVCPIDDHNTIGVTGILFSNIINSIPILNIGIENYNIVNSYIVNDYLL